MPMVSVDYRRRVCPTPSICPHLSRANALGLRAPSHRVAEDAKPEGTHAGIISALVALKQPPIFAVSALDAG